MRFLHPYVLPNRRAPIAPTNCGFPDKTGAHEKNVAVEFSKV